MTGGAGLPTFDQAVQLTDFAGSVASYATNPGTTYRLWAKWRSIDGVLSVYPAGGLNGVEVTTGADVTAMVEAMTGPGNPFTILSAATTIGGVVFPAGVYSTNAFIQDLQVTNAKIANLAIDDAKIANLSAAKITTGTLDADRIAADTITGSKIVALSVAGDRLIAGTITGDKIAANAITAGLISAGTITGDKIAGNTITAGNIQAGSISGDKIAGNTITAGNIASDTITGSKIKANTITTGNIAAGTITGTNIAAGTITGTNIQAGTIRGTEIEAGSITGAKIAGTTITASNIASATITGTQIAATTITAGNIVSGTLTAAQIQANSITADKLATSTLGVGTNLTVGNAAISGTTLTGQGGVIRGDGGFGFGGSTSNIVHPAGSSSIYINGSVVATSNIQASAVSTTTSAYAANNWIAVVEFGLTEAATVVLVGSVNVPNIGHTQQLIYSIAGVPTTLALESLAGGTVAAFNYRINLTAGYHQFTVSNTDFSAGNAGLTALVLKR